MNRGDLQDLARERLRDAKALLSKRRFLGAYYLAGYAVECALKACIAKQTRRHDFPDKKAANDSHVHDLLKLLGQAGLKTQLEAKALSDKAFELNWSVVKDWTVEDRYNLGISAAEARDLYSAIAAKKSGVMTWIRRNW
jgi:HEPN domain-containing protein